MFLFYVLCKCQKNLRFSSVSRGYKMGTSRKNGLTYKLFMLIFTKFKNSFFQGASLINYFWIFKWTAKEESSSHMVPSVHKQDGIDVQMKTLKTQGVQVTSIQCCFNVLILKQRKTNIISTPCVCREIVRKRTRKTLIMGCNLSKITSANLFSLHFIRYVCNETSKCLGWIIFVKIKTT